MLAVAVESKASTITGESLGRECHTVGGTLATLYGPDCVFEPVVLETPTFWLEELGLILGH